MWWGRRHRYKATLKSWSFARLARTVERTSSFHSHTYFGGNHRRNCGVLANETFSSSFLRFILLYSVSQPCLCTLKKTHNADISILWLSGCRCYGLWLPGAFQLIRCLLIAECPPKDWRTTKRNYSRLMDNNLLGMVPENYIESLSISRQVDLVSVVS